MPIPGGVPGIPGGVPSARGWDQSQLGLLGLGGLFQPQGSWDSRVTPRVPGELLVDELCLIQLGLTFGRKIPHFFGIWG